MEWAGSEGAEIEIATLEATSLNTATWSRRRRRWVGLTDTDTRWDTGGKCSMSFQENELDEEGDVPPLEILVIARTDCRDACALVTFPLLMWTHRLSSCTAAQAHRFRLGHGLLWQPSSKRLLWSLWRRRLWTLKWGSTRHPRAWSQALSLRGVHCGRSACRMQRTSRSLERPEGCACTCKRAPEKAAPEIVPDWLSSDSFGGGLLEADACRPGAANSRRVAPLQQHQLVETVCPSWPVAVSRHNRSSEEWPRSSSARIVSRTKA